jgi:hypothetical protein
MPIEKGEGKKQNFVQNALTASELLPGGDDDVSLSGVLCNAKFQKWHPSHIFCFSFFFLVTISHLDV